MTTTAPIVHEPVHKPRTTFREYGWYLLWQATMAREGAAMVIIGGWPFNHVEQRHATVAASFVLWLGSNVGRAMRDKVAAMPGHNTIVKWRTAWADENARSRGVNSGLRIVEHILVKSPLREDGQAPNWPAIYDDPITLDDLDVIDNVMEWMATYDGQKFAKAADLAGDAVQEQSNFLTTLKFNPE